MHWLRYAVLVVLMLAVSGCELLPPLEDEVRLDIPAAVYALNLAGYNGSIQWVAIPPGEAAHIRVHRKVQGFSETTMKEHLEQMTIQAEVQGGQYALTVDRPSHPGGVTNSAARHIVYAPVRQIQQFIASTSNGPIIIDDFSGYLELETSNGALTLHRGSGAVEGRTSNSAINLGDVVLTESSTLRTSNGPIQGHVALADVGSYEFRTSNGPINLTLPSDSSGRFHLRTSNGTADFQLGGLEQSGSEFRITAGDAASTIRIYTSNADISITEAPGAGPQPKH